MSVISVHETWRGQSGGINDKAQRKYARTFQVFCNNINTRALEVRLAAGVPRLFDYYITSSEFDLGARARNIDVVQDTLYPLRWEVTVSYDSISIDPTKIATPNQTSGSSQGGGAKSPEQKPPQYSWDFTRQARAISKDLDGKAILNSAGDPFDPPIEIDDCRPILTVEQTLLTFDVNLAMQYYDTVNSDTFLGFSPGQAKCNGRKGTSRFEENKFVWTVTTEIHFRRDNWIPLEIIDRGFHYLDGTPPKKILFRDPTDDQPMATPQLLNGNGGIGPIAGTDAQFQQFRVFQSLPFAALGLI